MSKNNSVPAAAERGRWFHVILYPDNPLHESIVKQIPMMNEKYACILHDKDTTQEGEQKKPHYHVVFYFENARTVSGVGKWLKLPESDYHLIQISQYKSGTLLYLVHADPGSKELEKYKYPVDDVKGSLKTQLVDKLGGSSESDIAATLFEFIETFQGNLSISVFTKYCLSTGAWAVYRRSFSVFKNIIQEHNYLYGQIGETKNFIEECHELSYKLLEREAIRKNVYPATQVNMTLVHEIMDQTPFDDEYEQMAIAE